MPLTEWVKLPTAWIENNGLRHFRWGTSGSDYIAALMSLMAIAHHANQDDGVSKLTYDELTNFTTLSRAKVSSGLKKLEEENLIERNSLSRSVYKLSNYDSARGWAKLPAKGLYSADREISAFSEFGLRKAGELNALKLFFLFVSRRDNNTNMANISYDKIQIYTGIERNNIKRGLSILVLNGLIHVEAIPIQNKEYGVAHAYRFPHIQPYIHAATRGRGTLGSDLGNSTGLVVEEL